MLGRQIEDEWLIVRVKVVQTTHDHHVGLDLKANFFWFERGLEVFPPDADPLVEVTVKEASIQVALPGLNGVKMDEAKGSTCDYMHLDHISTPIECKCMSSTA